jgi:hypothetical protein
MAEALRDMLDSLARLLGRTRAITALSTMVGAVVLARLADDPVLAEECLATAAADVLAHGSINREAPETPIAAPISVG